MAKDSKTNIEDGPGAEDRFLRGIDKAMKTLPKPFTPPASWGSVMLRPCQPYHLEGEQIRALQLDTFGTVS